MNLADLVDEVWEEVEGNTSYSKAFLSGWFLSNANLGKLNNLIDTCFSGEIFIGASGEFLSGVISPNMGSEEAAIYRQLFEHDYYNKMLKQATRGIAGIGGGGDDWVTLREGDSSITRLNKNESVKALRSLARDARQDLEMMVMNYLKFNTHPEQVVGYDEMDGGDYYRGVPDYSRLHN
jgi:hypothetical protein